MTDIAATGPSAAELAGSGKPKLDNPQSPLAGIIFF